MSFKTQSITLASAVATNGTFTVGYPVGTSRASFIRGVRHVVRGLGGVYTSPRDFTVAFGATLATITWLATVTLPAGTPISLQFDTAGPETYRDRPEFKRARPRVSASFERILNLGNPVVNAANAISLSQSVGAGAAALLNGATAGTLDVPRNVVAAWTGTSVLTVTGLDEYGNTMVEASGSGTSFTGVKAFARVTSAVFSGAVTGATIGTGNVLGLPIWIQNSANVLREFQDGAAPTAGTIVAGLGQGTKSTATTADVRGTYVPNATPDGSRVFELLVSVPDPDHFGNPQFAG